MHPAEARNNRGHLYKCFCYTDTENKVSQDHNQERSGPEPRSPISQSCTSKQYRKLWLSLTSISPLITFHKNVMRKQTLGLLS